jgi:DNA-binding CsgD family transcriptional regulator
LTFPIINDIYSHVTSLTTQDYIDVLDLAYDANRCGDMDSLVGTVCPSMMRIFRSECVTFHLVTGCPRDINVIQSKSYKWDHRNLVEDKYYPSLYTDGYYHQSPLLKEAIGSSKNVLKIKESISQKDWERSELYQNFIVPQHLYWEMFLPLRWNNNLEGMMTLWRTGKEPDFQMSDIEKSEVLMPHFMLAIHNIRRISQINRWQNQPVTSDATSHEGLILLDSKLRPVYSNSRAREICLYLFNRMSSGAFDIERYEFPIPSCIIQDCCDVLDLQKAKRSAALWPKERMIFVNNGKRFRVECSLIWKTDKTLSLPQFMVTLADPTETGLPTGLKARFSLTLREMEIVYCIIAGMSYREIAEKLCISRLTVHTHVKNIYHKLGVSSKIELVTCVHQL